MWMSGIGTAGTTPKCDAMYFTMSLQTVWEACFVGEVGLVRPADDDVVGPWEQISVAAVEVVQVLVVWAASPAVP